MIDLTNVQARDVMETDVVQLHTLTPIQAAIETLDEYGIHGAPVVDEAEQLVGVLSVTDIVRRDRDHDEEAMSERSVYYFKDPLDEDQYVFAQEDYCPEVLGRELVVDWITPRVISVKPDTHLAEVCRLMVREGVHRLFVVEEGRVLGIISTFDVVRRFAEDGLGRSSRVIPNSSVAVRGAVGR